MKILQTISAFFIASQHHLTHPSNYLANAYTVGETERKRLGRNSFLLKQERRGNKHLHYNTDDDNIASPEELKALASTFQTRKAGSNSYWKGWKQWSTLALESIRQDLSHNLPHPASKSNFEKLFFRLGVAADCGEMPSFEDAGARSGYALEFFGRAANLSNLYVDALNKEYVFPDHWVEAMHETPMLAGHAGMKEGPYQMVSLGGGPGFDFVAAALASSFSATTQEKESSSTPSIKATILDYEEGWGDLVKAMGSSTSKVLQQPDFTCEWGGKCDITKPLHHPSNTACLEAISTAQLWTCQYCLAENANLLKESKYVFFRDLFENATDGAIFVITETHPRIWPDLCVLIEEFCPYIQIGFNKNGRQMLLRKNSINSKQILTQTKTKQQDKPLMMMNEKDRLLLAKFQDIDRFQRRKIDSGYMRQAPKIRGS